MALSIDTEIISNVSFFIASVFIAIIGFFFKQHDSRIEKLEKGRELINLKMANDYAKKAEIERLEHAILTKMDRIEDKQDNLFLELSKKVDRP
jgi:hypothetical protein